MSALLYRLYRGEIISPEASRDMISILLDQKHKWGIPRLLPQRLRIANKTGSLTGIRNDAGIVYYKDSPYVLAIFTKMPNNAVAKSIVNQVSLEVYKWQSQKIQ